MNRHGLNNWAVAGIALLGSLLAAALPARAQDKPMPSLEEVPQHVLDGLKAKFPKAEIDQWTKETDGDIVIYDFVFTQDGQKFEADIKEDGSIHNWEKAIVAEDLPSAMHLAVEQKYPQAVLKEIMQITAVKNGQDELEGYEIVLETADMKEVEVTIAPDGKILEDSGAEARGCMLRPQREAGRE